MCCCVREWVCVCVCYGCFWLSTHNSMWCALFSFHLFGPFEQAFLPPFIHSRACIAPFFLYRPYGEVTLSAVEDSHTHAQGTKQIIKNGFQLLKTPWRTEHYSWNYVCVSTSWIEKSPASHRNGVTHTKCIWILKRVSLCALRVKFSCYFSYWLRSYNRLSDATFRFMNKIDSMEFGVLLKHFFLIKKTLLSRQWWILNGIWSRSTALLPYFAYSLDLAPSDDYLFSNPGKMAPGSGTQI